jgi:pimeloyl-ACP methyl ester carboxylesterase
VSITPTKEPPDELRALARLTFDEAGSGVDGLGSVHRAMADRVFQFVGPWGRPVQVAHDVVAGGVYAGLRGASSLLGKAADAALSQRPEVPDGQLSHDQRGAALIGVLNGLIGDRLETERPELVQPMGLRVDGRPVDPDSHSLGRAFPGARGRMVVFLHGLMETEWSWRRGAHPDREAYATRLARDIGCTPVFVRYNTGRHVSENGAELAELLERVVDGWPVRVREIALIGHSMGGLVSRSAAYRAAERDMAWVRRVRHTVSLGSPHMGAPLAQAVHYASAGLSRLPETAPFGAFLRRRSAGIRDLRQGSLVDEDWRDQDPDALRAKACAEVPLLEGATHCFVAATITRSPRHPVGRLVGDTLVLQPSASGRSRTRRIPFEDEYGLHVGGTHHIALLNHPEVYEKLHAWLATAPRALPPAG